MVDPQLRNGRHEDQQAEQKFLGRFFLDARENQPSQSGNERGKDNRPHRPTLFQRFKKLAFLDRAASLAAIAALANQAPALKKSEHVGNYSNGDQQMVQAGF